MQPTETQMCCSVVGTVHGGWQDQEILEHHWERSQRSRVSVDPIHQNPMLHANGAGTQDVRAFRYYYDQQLSAFDPVVLVHQTTLTEVHIRNYEADRQCGLEEARRL